MAKSDGLLRDIGVQAAGNYVSTGLRVIRGFVIAGMLGPSQMGFVATGNLFMNYAQYADVGITQGVGREIPMALGRRETAEAAAWGWYAILGKLFSTAGLAMAAVVWVLSPLGSDLHATTRVIIPLAAFASVAAGFVLALQTIARSNGDFVGASRSLILLAAANLLFGVVGARMAGAVGVTSGVLLASVITATYAFLRVRPTGFAGIRRERLLELLRVGVPLALLTFIGFNLENIDQVMILMLLDRTQLGLYTIVIQAGGLLTLTGLSVSNVVGPRLLRRYAQAGTLDSIRAHTWKPALALSAVMPMIIVGAWLVGSVMIDLFLPKYGPAIAPFKIYLAAMYFLSLNLGVSTTLLALGKHRLNVPIMLGAIAFNVLADLVIVGFLGFGIEGIALASLATYAVYWFAHSGLVRWYFEGHVAKSLRMNLVFAWPGAMLVVFLMLESAFGVLDGTAVVAEIIFLSLTAFTAWLQGRTLLPYLARMRGNG